jgi:PBP1b-binding outer membrane lipoprotein LpoB
MQSRRPAPQRTIPLIILSAAIAALVLLSGCTQAGTQSAEQKQFMEVTATQPDDTHMVITYQGGPNMEKIIELETMITDSAGRSVTKSVGSRLATTPITIKGTNTIEGAFAGKDHVVVTGYFSDGSRKVLLDTTV